MFELELDRLVSRYGRVTPELVTPTRDFYITREGLVLLRFANGAGTDHMRRLAVRRYRCGLDSGLEHQVVSTLLCESDSAGSFAVALEVMAIVISKGFNLPKSQVHFLARCLVPPIQHEITLPMINRYPKVLVQPEGQYLELSPLKPRMPRV